MACFGECFFFGFFFFSTKLAVAKMDGGYGGDGEGII